VIVLSLAGSVMGYLVFGLATTLVWLFVGRLAQGVCGANIATAQAYIADVTPPEKRARNLGMYLGAAFGLGFIFGPALGGLLARYGNLGLGAVAAGMSLCGLLLALWRLPESLPPEARTPRARTAHFRGLGAVLRLPGVARAVAVFGLATLGFSMMEGVFSLYVLVRFFGGDARTQAQVSKVHSVAARAGFWTAALFVTIGVVSTLVQGGLIGRLRARFGEPKLVVMGVGTMAVALALVCGVTRLAWLFPAMGLLALGQGLNTPSLSSLLTQLAPAAQVGEVLGVYQSMGSLSRSVGPALGGLVFELWGHTLPFAAAAGLLALAAGLALGLRDMLTNEGAAPA